MAKPQKDLAKSHNLWCEIIGFVVSSFFFGCLSFILDELMPIIEAGIT